MSLEAARVKESQLFASPNWSPDSSGIQSDRMGIAALRKGLSNVYCAHITREFPLYEEQTRKIYSPGSSLSTRNLSCAMLWLLRVPFGHSRRLLQGKMMRLTLLLVL